MEIKTKDLIQANYKVVAEQGEYNISANVTIGAEGNVINMDGGTVSKQGKFMASFGLFGDNANVNYSGLSLVEKNEVNELIEQFKCAI